MAIPCCWCGHCAGIADFDVRTERKPQLRCKEKPGERDYDATCICAVPATRDTDILVRLDRMRALLQERGKA